MIDIKINEENFYPIFLTPHSTFFLYIENNQYCLDFFHPQKVFSYPENQTKKTILFGSVNNSYSHIFISKSTFNQSEITDVIKLFVNKIPLSSQYELIVENYNFGTLQDFIENKNQSIDSLEFLYHGTSEYYTNIILNDGLKPRNITNVTSSYAKTSLNTNPYCCYLSTIPSYTVKDAANRAAKNTGSNPMILKISMNGIDKTKLSHCDKLDKNEKMSINDWLNISKNLLYFDTIDPKYIYLTDTLSYFLYPRILQEYAPIHQKIINNRQSSKENNDANRANTDASMQGK